MQIIKNKTKLFHILIDLSYIQIDFYLDDYKLLILNYFKIFIILILKYRINTFLLIYKLYLSGANTTIIDNINNLVMMNEE